ncbi:hypothetical protein DL769_010430 [Monosporascus sp. CRB-8-3]|nr:hypothetical protein DL769_010430 [Monosporascus sp. CRB-8-3]
MYDERNITKWRLPDLKTLYMVGLRGPEYEHGVPCGWRNVCVDKLDENYLMAADSIALPKGEDRARGSPADCRRRTN